MKNIVTVSSDFIRDDKFDIYEKMVFLALETYADVNSMCHPSQSKIANDLKISRKKVNEILQSLQDKGAITIVPMFTEQKGKTVNVYLLHNVY